MILNKLKPRKSLNKAFLKVKPNRSDIELFKANLIQLIDQTNDTESEEFHKNLVSDFLKKTYYDPNHSINTKGRNDLVIHNGKDAKSTVGVIIEAKKPTNKAEMVTSDNLNKKAFQELVLYYLRERITQKNLEIKYLIATNINEWFVFDATTFDRLFAQNKKLVKQFEDFEGGRLADTKTDFFYKQVAEPFIEQLDNSVDFTYFDLHEYDKPLRNDDKKDDNKLIALFKLLSPEHLLKLPFANDSNSLDKKFYIELLHIIGLEDKKEGGKRVIKRFESGQRNTGSLLENAVIQLDTLDKIHRLEKPSQYGVTTEDRLFNVGLELSITWVNRILFLKLLEAQLIAYHKGDESYSFLNFKKINNYDDLNSLFFQVLAKKHNERNEDVKAEFAKVPYLNSSLFEPNELEHNTILISNLRDEKTLPILSNTVLKDGNGKKRTGELNALEYFFAFLEAYDFSSEGAEDIQEDNKTLINASVLGLIFEKINGYKDGSFFTPGFITMYMCRETIRRSVVQKFNDTKGWNCKNLDDLYDKIEDRQEANNIVNSLKICDPAVGSGHFLVSALNEVIAIKNDLKIFQDRDGKRLKEYVLEVVSDELLITDDDGELFEYSINNKESQRLQETLFHEKQTIIENCLFGVDINPNSVKICRLRLWIELLKNAYYKNETELETLPNIDINIKCGNSLISRFDLDADIKEALKKSKWSIDSYRIAVDSYRNAQSKEEKHEMERLINDIKRDFRSEIAKNNPLQNKLDKLGEDLFNLTGRSRFGTRMMLFEPEAGYGSDRNQKKRKEKIAKIERDIEKYTQELKGIKNNKIYENAFEWRFEFPEVLNDEGEFVGFDVVIGNPPYAVLEKERNTALEPYEDTLKFCELNTVYNDVLGGKLNLYRLFIGLSQRIGSDQFAFIIPMTLMADNSLDTTRKFVLKQFSEIKLLCFPQKDNAAKRVFEDAKQSTLIILAKKDSSTDDMTKSVNVKVYPYNSFNDDHKEYTASVNDIRLFDTTKSKIPLVSQLEWNILKKMHQHRLISDIENILVRRGEINQTTFKSFITQDENHKALIKGVGISQYNTNKKYSQGIRQYFNEKKYLESGKTSELKSLRRIGTQRITGIDERLRLVATIIEPDAYFADSTNSISTIGPISLEYVLGFINSKLFQWRFKKTSSNNNVSTTEIDALPFIESSPKQKVMESKVTQILSLKKENPEADISTLEAEIDQLVYELYGLTKEEIKIIEESVK